MGGLACHSSNSTPPSLLPKEEIQEIRILSPYQNLKIFKIEDQWRGRFLPLNAQETQATESSFKSYPLDPEPVETLIRALSSLSSSKNSRPEINDLMIRLQTAEGAREWIVSRENPLRLLALKPSGEWRSKKILDEEASRIEEITLLHGKNQITLLRNPEEKWFWKERPHLVIHQDWVDSLARKISRLKAIQVGEWVRKKQAGLEAPRFQVLVKRKGQEGKIRVSLGNLQSEDVYYAQIEGLADWKDEVFTVNQETAEKLKTGPSQLLKIEEKK